MKIRVVVCPECHRRRRCRVEGIHGWFHWSCSQGHKWQIKIPTTQLIVDALKEIYREGIMATLYNSDTALYALMRRP